MRKKLTTIVFILVLLVSTNHAVSAEKVVTSKDLEVHFIDVGQGDSTLIETPKGKNILIDGGPPSAGDKLVNYLNQQGIRTIDLMIATHPDIDHIGGLLPVLKKYQVKSIMDSGKLYYTDTYYKYLQIINKKQIPIQIANIGEKIKIDTSIRINVLNAFSGFKNNNQSSIVLSLSYKQVDFLFMADVETEQEDRIAKNFNVTGTEIIKVGHHGSETSSSLDFLKKVSPEIALISYSKDNDYGHPVDKTIDNLLQAGSTIYSTAKVGTIVIDTDGKTYHLKTTGKERLVF